MNALVLALLLSAEPAVVEAPAAAASPWLRVRVGGEVGFPFLLGVQGEASFLFANKPRFDVDLAWEPSVTLQSYSVGAAYHVLDSFFFVGARLRAVTYQPPWARGPVIPFFGAGLELGVKLRVGPDDKGLIRIALHGTFVPGQASNLQTLLGVSAGFSWAVFEH